MPIGPSNGLVSSEGATMDGDAPQKTTAEHRQLTQLYLGSGFAVLAVSFLPFGATGVRRIGSLWEMLAVGNISGPVIVLVFALVCVSWPLHRAPALVVGYTVLAVLLMTLILIASLIVGDPVGVGAWLAVAVLVFCLVKSIRVVVG